MKFKDLKTGQLFLSKGVPDEALRKALAHTAQELKPFGGSYEFQEDEDVTPLIRHPHEIPGLSERSKIQLQSESVRIIFKNSAAASAFYEFLTPEGADFRRQMERTNLVEDAQSLIILKQELQEKFDAAGLVMDLCMIESTQGPSSKIAARIQEKKS